VEFRALSARPKGIRGIRMTMARTLIFMDALLGRRFIPMT